MIGETPSAVRPMRTACSTKRLAKRVPGPETTRAVSTGIGDVAGAFGGLMDGDQFWRRRARTEAVRATNSLCQPGLKCPDGLSGPRNDIDLHVDFLVSGAQNDSRHWRDVGVVASARQNDVIVAHYEGVGGIEADPANIMPAPG